MRIGSFDLERDLLVVAECGNNHEGDLDRARAMIDAAAEAGADAVKFQTFRTERFVASSQGARFRRLRGFELPASAWPDLAARARSRGLLFLSTPLDLGSAEVLAPLVDAFKVASGDLTFYPLLERLAAAGRPLIVSTGASTMDEVDRTVRFLRDRGAGGRLALLHCVAAYPAPRDEANLRAIETLAGAFAGVPTGYSDHVVGTDACLAAAALGARIIEKHFTLDHAQSDFVDHKIAVDAAEMRALVPRLKAGGAPAADGAILGDGEKRVLPCEEALRPAIRRSIAAARDLAAGTSLAFGDLGWTRPSGGLPPGEEGRLVGRTLRRAVATGERILAEDVA